MTTAHADAGRTRAAACFGHIEPVQHGPLDADHDPERAPAAAAPGVPAANLTQTQFGPMHCGLRPGLEPGRHDITSRRPRPRTLEPGAPFQDDQAVRELRHERHLHGDAERSRRTAPARRRTRARRPSCHIGQTSTDRRRAPVFTCTDCTDPPLRAVRRRRTSATTSTARRPAATRPTQLRDRARGPACPAPSPSPPARDRSRSIRPRAPIGTSSLARALELVARRRLVAEPPQRAAVREPRLAEVERQPLLLEQAQRLGERLDAASRSPVGRVEGRLDQQSSRAARSRPLPGSVRERSSPSSRASSRRPCADEDVDEAPVELDDEPAADLERERERLAQPLLGEPRSDRARRRRGRACAGSGAGRSVSPVRSSQSRAWRPRRSASSSSPRWYLTSPSWNVTCAS